MMGKPSHRGRGPARVGSAKTLAVGSLVILAVLVLLLVRLGTGARNETTGKPLMVYCSAGIKPPVEQVAKQYEQEFGGHIRLQYGPSGGLESQIQINPSGDLFIPAERDPFLVRCQERGLVAESIPLAEFRLVLAVRPAAKAKIKSMDDLLTQDIGYALANEQAAAGRLAQQLLSKSGHWDKIKAGAKVFKSTVTDVAQDVALGVEVDAGFIWDATARQFGLEIVELAELAGGSSTIAAGVLAASAQPAAALRFARYLAAPDQGGKTFRAAHFRPVAGDPWAVRPKITLFSGGVTRVAIQDTLKAFQDREGCDVTVVYHGCGTLVGMMKAGQQPDAYFACDVTFMDQVRDQFGKALDVSQTNMVILVRPGNPKGIGSLADFARPEMKVGLADEQLSALGSLTKRLLQELGLYEKVRQNRRTSSPTADFLVTQLVAHDVLDAVVVYEANCSQVGDRAEIVRIDHPYARAVQPLAIHRNNRYPQLTGRLRAALAGASSRARFESVGFRWLADQHD
ncbi:MAG: hypothetical protein A2W31_15060 [Planctomycetes bacterium RBG_16_64_10]|nr:MAG: hypothetical protein A2W31_15060 [Planctomycetes bacterium RBG_16_64_10]